MVDRVDYFIPFEWADQADSTGVIDDDKVNVDVEDAWRLDHPGDDIDDIGDSDLEPLGDAMVRPATLADVPSGSRITRSSARQSIGFAARTKSQKLRRTQATGSASADGVHQGDRADYDFLKAELANWSPGGKVSLTRFLMILEGNVRIRPLAAVARVGADVPSERVGSHTPTSATSTDQLSSEKFRDCRG
jgi:hypothetical protein